MINSKMALEKNNETMEESKDNVLYNIKHSKIAMKLAFLLGKNTTNIVYNPVAKSFLSHLKYKLSLLIPDKLKNNDTSENIAMLGFNKKKFITEEQLGSILAINDNFDVSLINSIIENNPEEFNRVWQEFLTQYKITRKFFDSHFEKINDIINQIQLKIIDINDMNQYVCNLDRNKAFIISEKKMQNICNRIKKHIDSYNNDINSHFYWRYYLKIFFSTIYYWTLHIIFPSSKFYYDSYWNYSRIKDDYNEIRDLCTHLYSKIDFFRKAMNSKLYPASPFASDENNIKTSDLPLFDFANQILSYRTYYNEFENNFLREIEPSFSLDYSIDKILDELLSQKQQAK